MVRTDQQFLVHPHMLKDHESVQINELSFAVLSQGETVTVALHTKKENKYAAFYSVDKKGLKAYFHPRTFAIFVLFKKRIYVVESFFPVVSKSIFLIRPILKRLST